MTRDWIRVKDISADALLYCGARWPSKEPGKATLQPVSITVSIHTDIKYSAEHDDLDSSINYSTISSVVRSSLGATISFLSLEAIARHLFDAVLLQPPFNTLLDEMHLRISQLKPPIHCREAVLGAGAKRTDPSRWTLGTFRHDLEDVDCHAIIGVNPSERLEKQLVRVNLSIDNHLHVFAKKEYVDVRALVRTLYETIGRTEFLTLEALTSHAAAAVLSDLHSQLGLAAIPIVVTVKAAKPFALVYAAASEVEISRTIADYPSINISSDNAHEQINSDSHIAAIAFGSNLGDSSKNIELALRMLEVPSQVLPDCVGEVAIVNTSFLYESTPMYVEDQPNFINGACLIETNLAPTELLRVLKAVESTVGRVPSVRNGPRAVDLDIIFYDSQVIDTRTDKDVADHLDGHLVVPHPRMCEREFVLRPLSDMIPDFEHPANKRTVSSLLSCVAQDPSLHKVMPVPRYPVSHIPNPGSIADAPSTLRHWPLRPGDRNAKTLLMAIVNATPDSFSDGSDHDNVASATKFALKSVENGADILDIGGYSTRPGAAFVSTEEEINRVVPIISCIRDDSDINGIPISVDTFRPEVAEAAILAGANIINDVYAFTGPTYPLWDGTAKTQAVGYMEKMKAVARRFAVPVVLMHSRGDAGSNKNYGAYGYAGESRSIVEGVRVELGRKVDDIVEGRGGVRRWLVVVDPGVGFSKTVEGNLEVLRNSAEIVADVSVGPEKERRRNPLSGYPYLIGSSRKSFLGTLISKGDDGRSTEPKERLLATAATIACAVQQGAAAVRVHDVLESADVLRVSDALW